MTSPNGEVKPLRLSWSRIREQEECSEKAWLHYERKAAVPMRDVRQFFRGTVVDRCMRDWLNEPTQDPGWMVARCAEILDREEKEAKDTGDGLVRWKSASDKTEVIAWCQGLLTKLEPLLFKHVIPH